FDAWLSEAGLRATPEQRPHLEALWRQPSFRAWFDGEPGMRGHWAIETALDQPMEGLQSILRALKRPVLEREWPRLFDIQSQMQTAPEAATRGTPRDWARYLDVVGRAADSASNPDDLYSLGARLSGALGPRDAA